MRSPICSCRAKVPDCFSSQSTSVVLPWSTWAMMAMLRIFWAMAVLLEDSGGRGSLCGRAERAGGQAIEFTAG